MIRDTVAASPQAEIAPLAAEIDRSNDFPRELWPKLGELGLHGITVEEEYGGAGLGYLEHVVAMEEISRASASRRPVLRRPLQPVRQPDPPLTARRAEAPLSAEADLGRACRRAGDERAGRRLGRGRRCAPAPRSSGDRYVLNGSKMWITNGPEAETLVVYAKTDPEAGAQGHHRLHHREGHARASRTAQKLDKLGMRGSDTCELVFEDCEVPAENVLGKVGRRRQGADARPRLRARWCWPAARSASCRPAWTW